MPRWPPTRSPPRLISSPSEPTTLFNTLLAIDRSDEQVAHLYNPLHPAVLRLIQFAIEAALRRGCR